LNENKAVARLSELLALEMGVSPAKARQIKSAAALHDIGKQRIPPYVLNKPGKLDAHEFEIIKNHTKLGVEMLSSIQGALGEMATMTALYHHEWHNPSFGGYWGVPTGYLPDYVSIVSICDVAVALVSKRSYKEPWPPVEVLAYIQNQAGTQFSEELVGVFIPLILNDSRVPAIFYSY
jgi:putative nucleotidyltransferase with HDIG domain